MISAVSDVSEKGPVDPLLFNASSLTLLVCMLVVIVLGLGLDEGRGLVKRLLQI